ncbi:hypothetical protein [Actinophytocola sp. NPDC049390]|uniref:hypothetical protein n=1 Tax=Actinophytocola sp. NPDC049390 TaxID=3363894 RepID=UPI0037920D2E
MNADLEDALTEALRAKADAVPPTPMPRLGAPVRRPLLVPVAAAVVAGAVGTAAFLFVPRDEQAPPAAVTTTVVPAESGVHYSLRLSALGAGGIIRETQLWQERERTGAWRQKVVDGTSIENGRVVPGPGRVDAPDGGDCYPSFTTTEPPCTTPASWMNFTVDFLASASRDPATIAAQLHAEAAEVSADLAPVLELRTIGLVLGSNGVPADLPSALREVVAGLPGVQVVEGMADLTGRTGTGYRLPHPGGEVAVIFDDDDRYLGSPTEAVRHGVAPGLGAPPSRMFD